MAGGVFDFFEAGGEVEGLVGGLPFSVGIPQVGAGGEMGGGFAEGGVGAGGGGFLIDLQGDGEAAGPGAGGDFEEDEFGGWVLLHTNGGWGLWGVIWAIDQLYTKRANISRILIFIEYNVRLELYWLRRRSRGGGPWVR